MNLKKTLLIFLLILAFAACTPSTPAITTVVPLTGQITFAGSTTVQPLADKLREAFNLIHPGVTLQIAAGGSTVGIKAIHDGTVDIGMASRRLKPDEAEGIEQHQIAVDVIAAVVNDANPVEGLTLEELRDIYLGEITNWREVGGEDSPITVIVRDKNSGTRGAFDDIVLSGEEPTAPGLKKALTAGDVAAGVLDDTGAIGYVGFGNLEPGLRALSIDDVLPSEENARSGDYPLVRPLLLLTGPLTQPLAHEFITYALSAEGQGVVAEQGWVPAQP